MIEWVAIAVIISVGLYAAAQILSKPAQIKSYKDALKIKDGMLDDLAARVRSLKSKVARSERPPEDVESAEDIDNLIKHLPGWTQPFAKPIAEWAKTDEGKASIEKLIAKWTKQKEKGSGAPGDGDTL